MTPATPKPGLYVGGQSMGPLAGRRRGSLRYVEIDPKVWDGSRVG